MKSAPAGITDRLLRWFAGHQRDLPWRESSGQSGSRDAYRVWVAEVMLQQTQAATVIPYYQRFLQRFPSLRRLAQASQDQVLKLWEGLGYYARARHLHEAANIIVETHEGIIPADREQLLKLPGIGDYIAGAILSLAYQRDTPALDANARRVLARLFAVRERLDTPAAGRRLHHLALELLPAGRAGPFNEAMIELGALICTPQKPACDDCPLSASCQAHRLALADQIPVRQRRRKVPHYDVTAAVIWKDGRVLLSQRPVDGMLGGLWEFPGGKCHAGEELEACLQREIREELGIEVAVLDHLISVPHAYSHMRITLHAFYCRPLAGQPRSIGVQGWRWVSPAELSSFALSVADQRIAAALPVSSDDGNVSFCPPKGMQANG